MQLLRGPTPSSSSPNGTSSALPTFEQMTKLLNTPVLFDGRNLWKPDSVKARGFTYYGVGRS